MATPKCPTCDDYVYFNEQFKVLGKTYHKRCFRCVSCNKALELGKQLENNGEPYCQTCYSKNHGPRGYGYGVGAGVLSGNYDNTPDPVQSKLKKNRSAKVLQTPEPEPKYEARYEEEEDEPEVMTREEKRASKRASKRRSHRAKTAQSEAFDEPEEEPFYEEEAPQPKRSSKRRSKRRSAASQESNPVMDFIEKVKEFCGCGRDTVKA